MVYQPRQFINGEIYHIILRGVGDQMIFAIIDDYYRGIFSIYEFNNANPVSIWRRRRDRVIEKKKEQIVRELISHDLRIEKRDKLVDVLSFCLMPNHIHLLIRQIKDGGITKFMRKVGAGYGGYFNRKYNRKGHLFQNRFQSVHIKDDNQLKIVFTYIHTNPISLIEPKWKEQGIKNPKKVIKFLEEKYRWSSYFDYLGKKNFPSITEREFMLNIMGGVKGCRDFVKNWVMHKYELAQYKNLFLE